MSDYALYSPASTPVSNLVTQLLKSFDDGKEGTLQTPWIKNPNLSGVNTANPMRYNGTAIVNLTQAEIDSINAANHAAYIAALKQEAKAIFITPEGVTNHAINLGFESLATVMKDQLNLIRANFVPPMANITMGQISTSFKTIYEAKVDAIT